MFDSYRLDRVLQLGGETFLDFVRKLFENHAAQMTAVRQAVFDDVLRPYVLVYC